MSDQMSEEQVQIAVKTLNKTLSVDEFTLDDVEPVLKDWEIGGLVDPVGQLAVWITQEVGEGIQVSRQSIENYTRTLTDAMKKEITRVTEEARKRAEKAEEHAEIIRSLLIYGESKATSPFWLADRFKDIGESIVDGASTIKDTITDAVGGVKDTLVGWKDIIMKIPDFFSDLFEKIKDIASGVAEIPGKIADFAGKVSDFFSDLFDKIKDIGSAIAEIPGKIADFARGVWAWFQNIFKKIGEVAGDIVSGVRDALSGVWDWFKKIGGAIADLASGIWDRFKDLGSFIAELPGKFLVSVKNVFQTLKGWLSAAWSSLSAAFSQVANAVSSGFNTFAGWLSDVANTLGSAFTEFAGKVREYLEDTGKALTAAANKVWEGLKAAGEELRGFADAFLEIPKFLARIPEVIGSWAIKAFEAVGGALMGVAEAAWGGLKWIGEQAWAGLTWLGGIVVNGFKTLAGWTVESLKTVGGWLWDVFEGVGKFIYAKLLEPVGKTLDAAVESVFKAFGMGSPEVPFAACMAGLAPLVVLGTAMKTVEKVADGVKDTEFEVFGCKIRPGFAKFLGAFNISRLTDGIIQGFVTGLSMAYFSGAILEGTRISALRSQRPYPSPMSHVEETWRYGYLTDERLDELLAYHGIRPDFVDIEKVSQLRVLGEEPLELVTQRTVKISPDGSVTLPRSTAGLIEWVYKARGYRPDLARILKNDAVVTGYKNYLQWRKEQLVVHPSYTDLIRFRVKEVPEELKQNYNVVKESAGKIYLDWMKLKGVHEYWALAYWDAHWRWISETGLVDLFFRGELKEEHLRKYLYWMDFQPYSRPTMPWTVRGIKYENDIDIIMRYLLRMPEITQTRWMVRWGLGGFEDALSAHARNVIARRMHPDWLAQVIVAEYCQTLTSARTHVRSAWERALRDGIKTLEDFEAGMGEFTLAGLPETVRTIGRGGEEVEVQLPRKVRLMTPDEIILEKSQIKLEIQRRVAEINLDALERAFIAGEISDEQLTSAVTEIIASEPVREARLTRIKSSKLRESITVFRMLFRRTIDAVLDVRTYGFMAQEEARNAVLELTSWVLTPRQVDIITREAEIRRDITILRLKQDTILDDLAAGRITPDEARRRLQEFMPDRELVDALVENRTPRPKPAVPGAGIAEVMRDAILDQLRDIAIDANVALRELKRCQVSEELAKALIAKYAPHKRLSVSNLRTMSEYVPVPDQMWAEKLAREGYPPEEAVLIRAHAFAAEVKEEMDRLLTELRYDYIDGLISDEEFKRELDNLATLGGTVKEKLGVDWIIYSPAERELIYTFTRKRRERKLRG